MIQAVIFNLDGVLVDTDVCHFKAWKRLAYEQGIALTPELYKSMIGMKRMDSLRILLKKAERSYSPMEMWALSARKNDLFNDLIDRLDETSLIPGAVDTVKRLRAMGLKTAVASSSENAGGILRQLHIRPLFDVVVDGCDIEKGKPDPEVFLQAARRLAVPTGSCLVIENSPAGEEAARQAGMRLISVDAMTREDPDGARLVTLAQLALPDMLAREREDAEGEK